MKKLWESIATRVREGLDFVADVRKELRNVSWPSRNELTGTTIVVIVAVFFFGFFLFVIDLIVSSGMDLVFRRAAP